MDEASVKRMNRRMFFRRGVLGAATLPFIAEDMNKVFGQISTAKPPLTMESLNAFFQKLPSMNRTQVEAIILAMRSNIEKYLTENFTATPRQLARFREGYAIQKAQYDAFLGRALDELKMRGQVTPPTASYEPTAGGYLQLSGYGMIVKMSKMK